MWINYYKETLSKLLQLFISKELSNKNIWVVLNSLLPFLIDHDGESKEIYQNLYRELAFYNPVDQEKNHNYISDEELIELIENFINELKLDITV